MTEEDELMLLADKNPDLAQLIERFDLHLDFTRKRKYRKLYNYEMRTSNEDFL